MTLEAGLIMGEGMAMAVDFYHACRTGKPLSLKTLLINLNIHNRGIHFEAYLTTSS
jgi:hypothetical protein